MNVYLYVYIVRKICQFEGFFDIIGTIRSEEVWDGFNPAF